jgi:hypothetical protein
MRQDRQWCMRGKRNYGHARTCSIPRPPSQLPFCRPCSQGGFLSFQPPSLPLLSGAGLCARARAVRRRRARIGIGAAGWRRGEERRACRGQCREETGLPAAVLSLVLLSQVAGGDLLGEDDRLERGRYLARWRSEKSAVDGSCTAAEELLDVAARFEAVGRLSEARARVLAIQRLFPSIEAPAIALQRLDAGLKVRGAGSCVACCMPLTKRNAESRF